MSIPYHDIFIVLSLAYLWNPFSDLELAADDTMRESLYKINVNKLRLNDEYMRR